jgi:flavoprotein
VQAIFRPQTILDLQIPDQVGSPPRQQFDLLMVVPISTNLVGVVYVADTTTASALAVAAATKYAIVEALPVGILPSGTHVMAKLRRLR